MTTTAPTFLEEDETEPSALDTADALEFSGQSERDESTPLERDAREHREADEPFTRWFGSADLTLVSFRGELGPSRMQGHEQELYVDGEPVSSALGPEDQTYYAEVFLHDLFTTGRAAWRGAESTAGSVMNGTEAVLAGKGVTLTFAERVEREPGMSPFDAESFAPENESMQQEIVSADEHEETLTVSLDEVLGQERRS